MMERLQVAGSRRECLGSGGYLTRGLIKCAALLNIAGAVNLGPGVVMGEVTKYGAYASPGGAALLALVRGTTVLGDIASKNAPIGSLNGVSGGGCREIASNISGQPDISGNNLGVTPGLSDTPVDFGISVFIGVDDNARGRALSNWPLSVEPWNEESPTGKLSWLFPIWSQI